MTTNLSLTFEDTALADSQATKNSGSLAGLIPTAKTQNSLGRVLVVDDEPDITIALARRLKASKFDVSIASDGYTATELAMRESPDAIILDIGLPAGDGHVVAQRLRENYRTVSIPIIFLTARALEADRELAEQANAFAFFTKPFNPTELLNAVEHAVRGDRQA